MTFWFLVAFLGVVFGAWVGLIYWVRSRCQVDPERGPRCPSGEDCLCRFLKEHNS